MDAVTTLTVTLTVGASAATGADVVAGSAEITAAGGALDNPGDDSDADTTSVARWVDLQVSVVDTPDPVFAGSAAGNLIYTVTLTNAGPSDASGIEITLGSTLPAAVTIDDTSPSAGSYTAPTWTLPALAAGAGENFGATLSVGPGAPIGIDLVSWSATVGAANESLISTGDDAATELTSIRQPPLFQDGFESGDTSAWTKTRPPP
jgi:uncharacterized repeat protein (TIGR01451 family)